MTIGSTSCSVIIVNKNPKSNNRNFYIGSDAGNQKFFKGGIDEIRMSNISRGPDWIKQTYVMVNNNSEYVGFGGIIPRPTPEIDLVPLFNRLGGLEQLIKENKPKNPDYSGILSSINEIKSTLIKEISKNKTEKMDLSGIESKINGMEGKIGDKFEKFAKEVVKDLVEAVDRIPDNLKDFSKNLKFTAVFPVALEKEQDDPEKKRLEEIKKKYNLK